MAREFSRGFYKSYNWKNTREYVFKRDDGLCQDCLGRGVVKYGEEVHHKIFLTPENINDMNITLAEENLILLCKECHRRRHTKNTTTREGLLFNEFGELIAIPPTKTHIYTPLIIFIPINYSLFT